MSHEYRRFWFASSSEVDRECLLAEAFEAGAEGAEEVEDASDGDVLFRACVYAPAERIDAVRSRVLTAADEGTEVGPSETMPAVDWSEAWKEGLEALRVSERLLVRPPFVEAELEPGQREVVIDPGQAFGTGGHASTQLCLEWIDALYDSPSAAEQFDRVLDAGTGSGVLAFAALVLGARSAVGFDLDSVAIEAARESAKSNGLAGRVRLVTSGIEELDRVLGEASGAAALCEYPLVVANLLKREVLPIAAPLAARVGEGGSLILAGLLDADVSEVLDRFAKEGFVEAAERRTITDATGLWVGLRLVRADSPDARDQPAASRSSQSS